MADHSSLNLYQKLAAITGAIGVIAKDGNNTEQNFKFIEYAAVAGRLRELFSQYGVVVVPRMQRAEHQTRTPITSKYGKEGTAVLIDMVFTVVNADKPDDKFTVQWTGEAADYGDKATNKAATSALKYYLMRQFNISEKGEDPDADSPDIKKPPVKKAPALLSGDQLKQIAAELDYVGVPASERQAVLTEYFGIEAVRKLTPNQAVKLIADIKARDWSAPAPGEDELGGQV